MEPVSIKAGQSLESRGESITHVYFMQKGVLSILASSGSGPAIEVGMIGMEGTTGSGDALVSDHAVHTTVAQIEGSALRAPLAAFWDTMVEPDLRSLWLRYAHVLRVQASQTALIAAKGLVVERTVRWLLMWQDRTGAREVTVSHQKLAVLLGVHRPTVTLALHLLQRERLLKMQRGKVIVIDREGMVARSKGYYGLAEAEYQRLIG